MHHLETAIVKGLRHSLRPGLIVPLYIVSLFVGLVQTWPVFRADLNRPFLSYLAMGGADAYVDLVIGYPDATGKGIALWLVSLLPVLLLFSLAYNFFAGGALSSMAGKSFWTGCLRTFWSYTALGVLLIVLSLLALVIASLLGMLNMTVMLIVAVVLLQLINLFGEYARAFAVARNRLNPFVLLGQAIAFTMRHPGTLLLALVGLLLQFGIALLLTQLLKLDTVFLPQIAVLLNFWLKQLRLGWALGYLQGNAPQAQPMVTSL
jgi:hypothetical protein